MVCGVFILCPPVLLAVTLTTIFQDNKFEIWAGLVGEGCTKSAKLNRNRHFKISAFSNLWVQSKLGKTDCVSHFET